MKHLLLSTKHFTSLFFFLLLSFSFSRVFAYDVVVAKDGSGNFTTIGAAINAAPSGRTTPYTIYIKNGKYKEKDTIPSGKPFIQLIGESVANVILTYDDYSGKAIPGGGVYGTGNSATLTVSAPDFTAINITFENTTGEQPQALAINVTGDRAAFKNCRFLGGQDTLFAGGNGARQYYRNCYIDGTVDFIFGDARAVFDSCIVYAKTRTAAGQSYITAANVKQTEPYGYVFRDCKIPANRGNTVYFLGRPWQNDAATADAAKSYNKTIYINTTMSSSVQPAGWSTWDAGTDVTKVTYAEYKSKKFDGSLVDVSQRVSWSKQLTDAEAANYSNATLFGTWNPCAVTTDFCSYTPAPIAVSNFKGVKGTSTSAFTWNISWPITGIKYEILRSSDRTTFTKVSEQTSANDSTINYNYSEAVPPPGVTYYYLIQASKSGYNTHISDTVTISSTPTITVTGSMGSFVQGVGTPSTSQSYIVSGASLTNNLIITAPAPYELSTNGSTWNTSSNPIALTQDVNGNIPNTTIFVRLNANSAGTYNGNIIHTSTGADTVRLAVTGTVQSTPLTVSQILEWWPFAVNNLDSSTVRSAGVTGSVPTFKNLYVSNGTTVPSVPAYSALHGQAFGVTANGDGTWTTASGGPGGTLSRVFYEQFVIKASSTHSLRIDSLILSSSFYNTSSSTKLAVVYSKKGFTTADSTDVTSGIGGDGNSLPASANGAFATPVLLTNETAGTTVTYRFAISVDSLRNLASGDSLTVRLYFSCGSGSNGRYGKLKNVIIKGLATANPILNDYRTHQTGNWTDLNTWERWDGTTWAYPAPVYPVYNNSNVTTILNGHAVTISATLPTGSGYIHLTTINKGGQLLVNSGAALSLANDGNAATTDLQVDGTLTLLGSLGTNGTCTMMVTGSVVTSGSFSTNTTDVLTVSSTGMYQHNANNPNVPTSTWQQGSTLMVTGLTTSQTGIFKNNISYGNIIWNNAGEANFYAYRLTLDSINVKGSFTVQSTGSTYIAFANTSGRTSLPGGFYQTGGMVNYKESGNIIDTLDIGGDFSVTGGKFISNMGTGSSLLVRLNGVNKTLAYSQNGATNTNWQVNGSYSLGANDTLPSAGFGIAVNGTLNAGMYAIVGAGNYTVNAGAIFSSSSPLGINGSITTTGTNILSTAANYIFNGSSAQVTGSMLPAVVNTLTINNSSSDVILTNPITITNGLTLTSGRLIAGSNNVVTTSVLGSSATKYVVTNGTGSLKIINIGAGANVFPVGSSATSYNPVTLNNTGGSDNFSVSVKNTFDNLVPDANKVVNRQWIITEEVPGGSNVTVSLSWTTADQAAGFDPTAAISIIRFNGTTLVYTSATISGAGTAANPYVATAAGFTSFSPFAVINNTALPLTLLSFNAGFDNNMVKVWWSTTNEINAASYIVEKSFDGRLFTSVGSVAAKNNISNSDYNYTDAAVNGVVYYRLKMVNKDGTISYSKVAVVNSRLKGIVSLYPNPATNMLSVTHDKAIAHASVEVIAIDGRRMLAQQLTIDATQTSVDVSGLAFGAYTLVIHNGDKGVSIAFIKK